nr:NAD(P)-dependent oxidoreductase [uncultured Oscillibacter sp.]
MKIVIIGVFPEKTREHIRGSFPADWELHIVRPEDAGPFLGDADAVIPEHISVDGPFLSRAPKLRLVQTGAGYDNVDIAECTRRGIQVCNAAGINAAAVAEHTMALILCWYKNIPYLDTFVKTGGPESELDYAGSELLGKTIGIVGLGRVGQRVAACCQAFGMNVLGHSRHPVLTPGIRRVELERLYEESDIVTVHVPLLPETRHLIDAGAFSRMKPDALFVNTARGAVVEEDCLVDALRTHRIGGACLDVYEQEPLAKDHPLRSLSNVILTPHTAGYPDGVSYHRRRYAFFAANIQKLMSGSRPDCALNTV